VPNFGVDKEILATQRHISEAEKKLGTKLSANKKDKDHPMDYKVPNFGIDTDIKQTQRSLQSTEKKLGKWNPKQDADGAYVVPTTVALQTESQVSLESDPICSSAGCTQYEHPKLETHPMDYFVPNFGPDHEAVRDADSSLAIAEKQLNHKLVIPEKVEHDKDYFVPHFGVDADILASQASETQASDTLNHSWTPTQDKNGFWNVPQPFDNKSYTYADSDINVQLSADVQSDPICSSAGCTQYEHPKLETHPMDYPVPNFGVDHDVLANHNSLEIAEKQLGHKWTWVEHEKPDPVYYDDGTVKGLDSEITHSLNSMADQEAEKGAWNPVQNKDGDWIVPQAIDNRSYSYEGDATFAQLESDPICPSTGCPDGYMKTVEEPKIV